MDISTAIEVINVSKIFNLRQPRLNGNGEKVYEHYALENISFEVRKGDSVGIIGSNGSGKSTLLKILAGITKPSSGEVKIRGRVASILDIGAGFHPELSGKENVFLNGQILGFSKREVQQKYDEIVAFSGIEHSINESVKNYSNGMYLRLAFSIMAHLDFDVYLFDEVMSVGDSEFNFKAKLKLQELQSSKKTILFVSHNHNELNSMDSFIHIEDGILVGDTNQNDVLTDYYEQSMRGNNQKIALGNTILTDFSNFPKSNFLNVRRVEMFQEEGKNFCTSKPISFTLEYEKLSESDMPLNVVILINDFQGSVILSTNPLISGFPPSVEKGVYSLTCVFPASIFGFQVYNIGLLFSNNALMNSQDKNDSLTLSETNVTKMVGTSYRMHNVISFKPQFTFVGGKISKTNLSAGGGLLPILDWTVDYKENN